MTLSMDLIFKALADSTRRAMLDKLLSSPGLTLGDLVADTDMRRQSATKHLKLLEEAGLVHVKWEGREKLHFLNPVPIQEISGRWVDKFSKVRLDALQSLKSALESDKRAATGRSSKEEAPSETKDQVTRGPSVTSFFTPIED